MLHLVVYLRTTREHRSGLFRDFVLLERAEAASSGLVLSMSVLAGFRNSELAGRKILRLRHSHGWEPTTLNDGCAYIHAFHCRMKKNLHAHRQPNMRPPHASLRPFR